jgi:hypothetical protein
VAAIGEPESTMLADNQPNPRRWQGYLQAIPDDRVKV